MICSSFDDISKNIEYPVIILSSKAGLGNYSVGKAIEQRLEKNKGVAHYCVDDLLPGVLRKKYFERHKIICRHAPWLLFIIYGLPISYIWGYLKEFFLKSTAPDVLGDSISSIKFKTVICTNHRACFFVSALKRKKMINPFLIAVLTDYHMNTGWRFLFWDNIDRLLGPISADKIISYCRPKYRQIELPLRKEIDCLDKHKADVNNVLITGGGWGIGPVYETVCLIYKNFPQLNLHVVCGDNICLFNRLKSAYYDKENIQIYGQELVSLIPLLEICGSVVSKPGGVIITEAFKAGRKLFLIKGLPVTEERNAVYAVRNFNASFFSLKSFSDWYYTNKKNDWKP